MRPLPGTEAQRQRRFKELLREQLRRQRRDAERRSIAHYIRRMWPWFILEEIHLVMAGYLEALVYRQIDRYMQFLAPRAGKSMIGSIITPTFYLGQYPGDKVMQASHQKELAVEFGRDARDLVMDADYRDVFPNVRMRGDAKAAGRWYVKDLNNPHARGAYFAAGVTGGIAGKGWNLGSADDLLNEQTAFSEVHNRRVLNWWGPGFYTRRQPDRSAVLLTTTRWRKGDIAGFLLNQMRENKRADQYTVLRVPAVIDEETAEMLNEHTSNPLLSPTASGKPLRYKAGMSFSPRRWPMKELIRQKNNMSSRAWDALYQQNPTDDEGSVIKRSWWRPWTSKDGKPPTCLYVIQFYDTAFEEEEMGLSAVQRKRTGEPDYSARSTWGVFEHTDHNGIVRPCMILIEAWHARVGFPELRDLAFEKFKLWKPNKVAIEKKASGHSLLQEMRKKKVPIIPILIQKGASKTVRAHAASVVWEQGCAFYMADPGGEKYDSGQLKPRADLAFIVDECTDFPFGDFDDGCDTAVHAAIWLRRTMWVQLPGETEAEQPQDERDEAAELEANNQERRMFG